MESWSISLSARGFRVDRKSEERGGASDDVLPRSFFARPTERVARDLLGREIRREFARGEGSVLLRARIVETEAYLGEEDRASHGSRGPTPRAKVMFGEPGVVYVYFIYGNHHMLNFVTEKKGTSGAVLIRAVEPLEGLETMTRNRGMAAVKRLSRKQLLSVSNGPGKLVQALGIDGALNGEELGGSKLMVCRGVPVADAQTVTTTRIGISASKELPLRFYERGNDYVSVR